MRNPWAGEEEGSSGGSYPSGVPNKMEEPWAALSERSLVTVVDQLFFHLLKVLNICAHVLDDTPPGPAVKVGFLSLWISSFQVTELLPLPLPAGHTAFPDQHALTQSHSQKGQREGGC